MIIKSEFNSSKKNYESYVNEQNVVANCELDQTSRINYEDIYFKSGINNILDIGCRDGKFINRYSKLYNVYGIDIGPNAIARAISNFGHDFTNKYITLGDIQDSEIINKFDVKFDFINFSHVIEHLLDPSKGLQNIKKIMADNATMLIIIPGDMPRFKTIEKCISGQPYHEIFWENSNDVKQFIYKNGFEIIKFDEINLGHHDGEWRVLVKVSNFDKNKKYHNEIVTPKCTENITKYKNYSMLGNTRIMNLINKCIELNNKYDNGTAIECGVANGGSLQIMRNYLSENIHVYGFDSFSHMPELTDMDENESRAITLNFNKTNDKLVGKIFGSEEKCRNGFVVNNITTNNLYIVKGYFENTIPQAINNFNNIILLRLDADWYEATYFLLDKLYDRVVKGGIVIIDDFYAYIGCRKAVIDFFNDKKIQLPYIYHTHETGLSTITGGTEVFWYKE